MTELTRSRELLRRAEGLIPSASQTFSKAPNQWVRGVSPHYLARGDGAWVWDVDGNKYLDYLMGLGPIILGYNHPRVNEAVARQLADGPVFSQMHPLEVEVAELLVDVIPCAEMVRFGKNGSDATTAAIRVARAFTGRDHVAICGYHGWHDWYIGTTTRRGGIPEAVQSLSHTFTYNDLASLERLFAERPGQIAAVIVEAVSVEAPAEGFLAGVKALCEKNGALLVFDEVVSGFRVALGGAQEKYGVVPDLATFGKAMGNGMPIAAVVGRRDVMRVFDDIFFSGTFGGETLSLAACKATIQVMREEPVLDTIAANGDRLMAGINDLIGRHDVGDVMKLIGFGCRSLFVFPDEDERRGRLRRTYLMQECHKRGLLFYGVQMPTYAHGAAEVDFTLQIMEEVFPLWAAAVREGAEEARLEGPPVEPVFRKP